LSDIYFFVKIQTDNSFYQRKVEFMISEEVCSRDESYSW